MNQITNGNYYVEEISAKLGREIVKQYHYSKKVVPNSKLHLGIFSCDSNKLVGCLQYGPPMNPKSTPGKILEGSTASDMFELNRMVLDDEQPKNSESQAISLCNKWLRKNRPDIKYLLSFSDGKEGNVGYIYQATNWIYLGFRTSDSFYLLDDVFYHAVQIWHLYKEKHPDRDVKTTHEILYDNFNNVSKVKAKQFTYVFPLKDKKLFKQVEKYPKMETERKILEQTVYKKNGVVFDKPKKLNFKERFTEIVEKNHKEVK